MFCLLAGILLICGHRFLRPANQGQSHPSRGQRRSHPKSTHYFHHNSSPILKHDFEKLPNDADGARKPVFANYKLRQHGLRHGIGRRLQTVLLKITSP
jgi:hypothetical protein